VRASKFKRPGRIRESIMEPWHFGHAGVSIATGELPECCDRDTGMMFRSNGREHKTIQN